MHRRRRALPAAVFALCAENAVCQERRSKTGLETAHYRCRYFSSASARPDASGVVYSCSLPVQ